MKIKLNFVSNSSSCSFVLIGNISRDLLKKISRFINFKILNDNQTKKVIDYLINNDDYKEKVKYNEGDPVYLTQFISDASDYWSEFHDLTENINIRSYEYGSHDGPYDEEEYDIIFEKDIDLYQYDAVWIRKEHNEEE